MQQLQLTHLRLTTLLSCPKAPSWTALVPITSPHCCLASSSAGMTTRIPSFSFGHAFVTPHYQWLIINALPYNTLRITRQHPRNTVRGCSLACMNTYMCTHAQNVYMHTCQFSCVGGSRPLCAVILGNMNWKGVYSVRLVLPKAMFSTNGSSLAGYHIQNLHRLALDLGNSHLDLLVLCLGTFLSAAPDPGYAEIWWNKP